MGTSGRYEMDPVSNPTGVMRSGVGKSFGGAAGGQGGDGGAGNIVVENTISIQYGRSESNDGTSCASVKGLVQGRRASAEDEESGLGGGGRRGSR
jgi:hypothetical protein